VTSTLDRIRQNKSMVPTESNDGGFFNFNSGELPNIPRMGANYYMEFVVWPNVDLAAGTYDTTAPSVQCIPQFPRADAPPCGLSRRGLFHRRSLLDQRLRQPNIATSRSQYRHVERDQCVVEFRGQLVHGRRAGQRLGRVSDRQRHAKSHCHVRAKAAR